MAKAHRVAHRAATRGGLDATAELTQFVIDRLQKAGHTAWRTNSGGRFRGVRLAPPGTPDVVGFAGPLARRPGTFIGVEVKASPTDTLNDAQQRFRDDVFAARGYWCQVRHRDEFTDWCKAAGL